MSNYTKGIMNILNDSLKEIESAIDSKDKVIDILTDIIVNDCKMGLEDYNKALYNRINEPKLYQHIKYGAYRAAYVSGKGYTASSPEMSFSGWSSRELDELNLCVVRGVNKCKFCGELSSVVHCSKNESVAVCSKVCYDLMGLSGSEV